jgi:CHASE2 domain-containing sensor protein
VYLLVYYFHNLEYIRDQFEDFGFDTIMYPPFVSSFLGMSHQTQSVNAPNTLIIEIDKKYLEQKHMISANNEPQYGYVFPRRNLAEIIEKIDTLSPKIKPKAVLIDYDLSMTMLPGGHQFSEDDQKLLDILSKKHDYKILIPITGSQNIFYDRLKDKSWILPASVSFSSSSDSISRRFIAFENGIPNASLIMYSIANHCQYPFITNGKLSICNELFDKQEIITNRVISKTIDKNDGFGQSKWSHLSTISASMIDNLEFDSNELKKGTFIFIGSGYDYANDTFNTGNGNTLSGVEMHANTFVSHFFLPNGLKQFNLLWACITIFFATLFFNIFFLENHEKDNHLFFPSAKTLFFISALLFSISYALLLYWKTWFNWSIPWVAFGVIVSFKIDFKKSLPATFFWDFYEKYFKQKIKKDTECSD